MGGRILALKEQAGYRPVLIVQSINRYPQRNNHLPTTVFAGEQVLLPFGPTGGTSTAQPYKYSEWFSALLRQPLVWNQMRPNLREDLEQYLHMWPKLPIFSVKQATLTLLAAGTDPLRGSWLQFAGNVPLFDQPDWWVETDEELFDYDYGIRND